MEHLGRGGRERVRGCERGDGPPPASPRSPAGRAITGNRRTAPAASPREDVHLLTTLAGEGLAGEASGAERGFRTVRPQLARESVVNRCGGGWSAVADAPSAPAVAATRTSRSLRVDRTPLSDPRFSARQRLHFGPTLVAGGAGVDLSTESLPC